MQLFARKPIKTALTAFASAIVAITSACTTENTAPCVVADASLVRDPVLFVHGYLGNGGNWQDMKARFVADGWRSEDLYAYNYSFTASNAASAAEIRDQVEDILCRTGASRVDIVAFSMGSVSSRYYLKNLGGISRVDAWASLAGPNHGTDAIETRDCNFEPCRETAIGSQFLADLNSGDETPGLVRYATWRSPCDDTINPDESVVLSGATNVLTHCIAHIQFLTDPNIYQQVRAFID